MNRTELEQCTEFVMEFLEKIFGWIAENYVPEDVFSDEALELWAEENGYVKENE